MTHVVRPITTEELVPFMETLTTVFLQRPDVPKIADEVKPLWDLERTWAAFDGDRMCGTFRTWATELTVPGGAQLPASAVSAVTVLPTDRRRGVLRAMTAAEHAAIRRRGEVVGLLYAAEYPIYGRFGYGVGCRQATWTVHTSNTGFIGEPATRVELVKADEQARDTIKAIFDTWRLRQAGEIKRRDYRWDFDLGMRDSAWGSRWKGFVAIHRDAAGTPDGYALYKADEKWERGQPHSELTLNAMHALNDEAYAALWRFLAEIDWVAIVKAEGRRVSERLPWLLTNGRAASVSDFGDGIWVRVFDVVRAMEARTYEQPGHVILEVMDAELPDGRIRVELDASPDGSQARITQRPPDLTIGVRSLGAAYLGGIRLRDVALSDGVDEHRNGALGELDALLATRDEPWCSTFF